MFSAIDGFRFGGSPYYVALYNEGANYVGTLSIAMNDDGNVYLGGSGGVGTSSLPIVVTDFTGYIQTQKGLEGVSQDPNQIRFIQFDSTGNIYAGGIQSGANSNNSATLVKLDSNLNILWQTSVGDGNVSNSDGLWCGVVDSSDNIIVGGEINNPPGPTTFGESFIIKYDSSGNILYSKKIDGYRIVIDMAIDSSDNLYTSALQNTSVFPDGLVLEKWYSNGDFVWGEALVGGTADTTNTSEVKVDSGGNIFIDIFNTSTNEKYLNKFDTNGTLLWSKSFIQTGNASNVRIGNLLCCDNSNVYISDSIPNLISSTETTVILKIDSSGNKVWERSFLSSYANLTANLGAWANGYLAFTGIGTIISNSQQTMSLIKMPDDGSQTGIYGNITYATSNVVSIQSASPTWSSSSNNANTISFTSETTTFTANALSLGYNITSL